MKEAYLINVTVVNNNKFYHMTETPGGKIDVVYGRIGTSGTHHFYEMSEWDSIYNKKINKGYKDVTSTRLVSSVPDAVDEIATDILSVLKSYAKATIRRNYTIAVDAVTPEMLRQGYTLLNALATSKDISSFNNLLLQLFTVLPRAMTNVRNYLASSVSDFPNILTKETELLDVLSTQCMQSKKVLPGTKKKVDIAKELGLTVSSIKSSEEAQIKKWLGSKASLYSNAWCIRNLKTYKAFNDYLSVLPSDLKDVRCLWHGSRNENWFSILSNGLVLRPTSATIQGHMFGYGLYFANSARKSYNYTSGSGAYYTGGRASKCYLALFDVIYGKPLYTQTNNGLSNCTYKDIERKGFTSVHAKAGSQLLNDEIIVYREEQCTLHYLVELKTGG